MDFRTLELFLQLKRTEHMAETADFFNISQPSLSKTIARLEEEVGVKLFDRVGRHIRLNKSGEDFAVYAEKAMQLIQTGITTAKSAQYEVQGRIRIQCRAFGPILSDCIAEYSVLNPQVEFIVCQSGHSASIQELQEMEEDFILCSSPEHQDLERQSQIWVGQKLFSEPSYAVISASCPQLQGKQPVQLSDLENVPFVVQVQNDIFFTDATYEICQQAGFLPRILYRTDNFLVKISFVKRGLAATILPRSCLAYAQSLVPDLAVLPLPEGQTLRNISIMRRKEIFMTETAADFWEFLLDYYHISKDAAPTESQ